MDNDKQNEKPCADDASVAADGAETTDDVSLAQAPPVKDGAKRHKRKKPLLSSVASRTTVNYIMFAAVLLLLLWAVFFFGLYSFYGRMIEREADDVLYNASIAFPKKYDDNSMDIFYKTRLAEIARGNKPVAIAVFTGDEGEYDMRIVVDDMGIGATDNNSLFNAVMEELDFSSTFERDDTVKVSTHYGTFLCCGATHYPETENGVQKAYILVMKPYDLFNAQTMKLISLLIIGTVTVLAVACVFSFFASRFQTKRLKDFSQKAKRVADGDFGVKFSGGGYDEYDNLAAALNAATDNLQKSEKLQRDIVANVSHDIRTPLTMIRAYAEMIRDLPLDDKKRVKTTNVIISETDRLAGLVEDVLNYSKLQAGVTEFKFEQCDLSDIATAVIDRFDIARGKDGIKLVREIDDSAVVSCDKQKIEQVFYNLISNAINYCGDDKTVILRVIKTADKVRVEVTDHGKGIEPDEIDSVWDRYYRSEHATRTVVGSGLGLSICKSVLTAHEAQFGVVSELGSGSTFWFELDPVTGAPKDKQSP